MKQTGLTQKFESEVNKLMSKKCKPFIFIHTNIIEIFKKY